MPGEAPAHDESINRLMSDYQGQVPGASVVVARNGSIAFRRAYGMADLEHDVPATPATSYRLASVSKQFTAAAILLLVQDKRLRLDDPVRRWLPSLPDATAPATLQHLLTHTSGLIDYEEIMPANLPGQINDDDVLRLLEGQNRCYFHPGSQYRYSDSGYALLSLVVARASGVDFASFLSNRIFQPLGMVNTLAYQAGVSTIPNRAYGYSRAAAGTPVRPAAGRLSSWIRTDQSLTSAVLGDGGIYSCVDDLARWDQSLYADGPLEPEYVHLAFTPSTRTDDPNVAYGLGWRITGQTVWHSGESLGFRNVIVRFAQQRTTVVILTNRNESEPYTAALAVAKLFIPEADAVRASRVIVGPDSGAHPVRTRTPSG